MVRLDDYSTLSFDCYGTLVDWESGILASLRPWAEGNGLDHSDEELLEAFARAESHEERSAPEAPYPEILSAVLLRIARELGAEVSEEEARAFGRSVPSWPAFPDSPKALEYLGRHFRLVILSNVDRESFRSSETRLGIRFDRVFTAEDIGSYKPDPANFRYLLEGLSEEGVASAEILHVAQSLHHDIEPARALGLSTVWVDRRSGKGGFGATAPPKEPVTADLRVESLVELADLHRSQSG